MRVRVIVKVRVRVVVRVRVRVVRRRARKKEVRKVRSKGWGIQLNTLKDNRYSMLRGFLYKSKFFEYIISY